jgi:hypothetical protein
MTRILQRWYSVAFRGVSVAVALLLLSFFGLPVASAAETRNDDFRKAIKINKVPFSHLQNTSGATRGSEEPYACDARATVWFKVTPEADTR